MKIMLPFLGAVALAALTGCAPGVHRGYTRVPAGGAAEDDPEQAVSSQTEASQLVDYRQVLSDPGRF